MFKIAKRFTLFTHEPGVFMPVPFSHRGVQLFPTAIKLLQEDQLILLNLKGPVKKWTASLDLEKGLIQVSGFANDGFFRYSLFEGIQGLVFKREKGPIDILPPTPYFDLKTKHTPLLSPERLFLGIDKQGEWPRLHQRQAPEEFLPYWYMLGQSMPVAAHKPFSPTLLGDLEEAIGSSDLLRIKEMYRALFLSGFKGMFYPQNEDSKFYGFQKPPLEKGSNPFALLTEGSHRLRSLVFREDSNSIHLAPLITSLFSSGRVGSLKSSFGPIEFEWSRFRLRALRLKSEAEGERKLLFPKELKKARLHVNGKKCAIKLPFDLFFEKDKDFIIDNFEI